MTFVAGLGAGAVLGWILALLLRIGVPEPPHPAPTRLGWGSLGLGLAALGAGMMSLYSGAITGPLLGGGLDLRRAVADPTAWSVVLAVAGLFLAFLGAGRLGDRRWPTGLGLLLAGGVLLGWLVLWLSRLGEVLMAKV